MNSKVDLEEVRLQLCHFLGPEAVLVGQGIEGDIAWMMLEQGKDFLRSIDLSALFKAWNSKFQYYAYFSLAKTAWGLLGEKIQGENMHSPEDDARVSLRLYFEHGDTEEKKESARKKLFGFQCRKLFPEEFLRNNSPANLIEDVCMYAFDPVKCQLWCQQPTKKKQKDNQQQGGQDGGRPGQGRIRRVGREVHGQAEGRAEGRGRGRGGRRRRGRGGPRG